MKILNESTLDQFREQTRCELCNRTVGGCEPHHWYARGMGGGHRIDVALNLVGLCRYCHQRCEDGVIPRRLVLLHIANRHSTTPDAVEEALWLLDRMPRGTTRESVLLGAAVQGGEVERLIREVM